MKIELILLGVIGLVFLVDFIMNSRKKPSIDNVVDQIEGEQPDKKNNPLNYLLKRKRNIVTFVLLVVFIKLVIHYFIYPNQEEFVNYDKEITPEGIYNARIFNWENVYVKDSLGFLIKSTKTGGHGSHILNLGGAGFFTKKGEEIRIKTTSGGEGHKVYNAFYYPKEYRSTNFATHLQNLFEDELWIFLVSIGALTVIVFLFNDKIKAR